MTLRRPAGFAAALFAACCAHAAAPRLELDVRLDPQTRALHVEATLRADRLTGFALRDGLNISQAVADGKPVELHAGPVAHGVREWRLARSAQALRIAYQGTLAPLERGADHRRVLRALPPMASPEGSFLPAGSLWVPWPGAMFTYRLHLSLPAGQRGLVPGDLREETIATSPAARTVATFEMRMPSDGIDLMAGPYVVDERIVERPSGGPLRLRTYFTEAIQTLAKDYLDDSQRYLERYSKEIGAYPFASFSVVASPLPTGFGMPTLTYIGEAVLRLPFIRASSLGHEVLHNWWGNGVLVDYAAGNWSEGLTTFMADYAYKEEVSADAAREMRLGWLRDFAALPQGAAKPLTEFRSRAHGADAATGYGKAAMLFVMLRDLIGRAAFEQGVRGLWSHYRFREASWNDLRKAFEAASGRDLSVFFKQWLERAGAPVLRVASARARGSDVEVTLEQSAPPYLLHVPLELVGGAQTLTRDVAFSRARETLRIEGAASASAVRLDPDLRLWRRLDPQALPPILREWILARAPQYAVVTPSDDVRAAAERLAQRLFESPARPAEPADGDKAPLLIVGLYADVDTALARLGLPPRPAQVARSGSARVWTIPRAPYNTPIAVVSARDAEALAALERPLPHYGAQSWLVFDGRRALARGVWPLQEKPTPIAR
ncbi:MAG: M1 family peptidase [Betaproteobacteria bacterium]|nr:M1 family peptidase [Betaproteobacteria bacterium]